MQEDLALAEELLALVPGEAYLWQPPWQPSFTVVELACHLVESFGGVCACLAKLEPESFTQLPSAGLTVAECRAALAAYGAQLSAVRLPDDAWQRHIPTYFAPAGEPALAVLLVNLKHCGHHVYQLFTYLKLLGVPVTTRHLHRF